MKKINELINPNNLTKKSFFEFGIKKDFQDLIKDDLKLNILTKDLIVKDKVLIIKGNSKVKLRILLNKSKIINKLNNLIRDIK